MQKSQFAKAKEQCLKLVQKEIDKRTSEGREIKYDLEDKARIEPLSDFPKESKVIRYLDVKYKAKFLKAQLEETFPNNEFSVRIERYSGGSAIDGTWKGPKIEYSQLRAIENLYQDAGNTDSSVDYFDHDNYVYIQEDAKQFNGRYLNFPSCNFCGGKQEKMAITTDGRNCCMYCVNRREADSFRMLPKW